MSKFDAAVALTIAHEGGYVNDPDDKGGATKYGITQSDMLGVDIGQITVDQAKAYYSEHYWKPLYGDIEDQDKCNKLFDMGVLFGVGTAVRLAQAVLGLHPSEIFDSSTLVALNASNDDFLPAYKGRLTVHARWIPIVQASQKKFVDGWVTRIGS